MKIVNKNMNRRLCFMIPYELEWVFPQLLTAKKSELLSYIIKYIVVCCLAPVPKDMQILAVEDNLDYCSRDVYLCSSAFSIVAKSSACYRVDLSNRDSITAFFRGLKHE